MTQRDVPRQGFDESLADGSFWTILVLRFYSFFFYVMATTKSNTHKVIDDVPQLSLVDHAKAGLPLNIPWMRSAIKVGDGLRSDKLTTTSPWVSASPFDFRGRDGKW